MAATAVVGVLAGGCVPLVDEAAPPDVTAPPSATASPTFDAAAFPLTMRDQKDGDSFVASDGVEYRVGMIDTPEVGACGADDATAATALFLADGFAVEPYAEDGNGRTVARVRSAAGDLGVFLAREGYADDRYVAGFRDEHPSYAAELEQAFAAAKAEGAGIWGACR